MLKTVKNVLITVGLGIISFWFVILWAVIFGVTGVLLLVDLVHFIWTGRRIHWIEVVTDGWADLFDHPFSRHRSEI